jgi:hypothetical protein
VKKTLALVVLGVALLAASGVANAEPGRAAEPRWGIRPDRTAPPSPLDLARWLARRLAEAAGDSNLVPFAPPSNPLPLSGTGPAPVNPDEVCIPERSHCPLG